MDNNELKNPRVAKGKAYFQTQIPEDLVEEMREFSQESGIPVTILTEKFIAYGLAKAKATGSIPLDPKSGVWS